MDGAAAPSRVAEVRAGGIGNWAAVSIPAQLHCADVRVRVQLILGGAQGRAASGNGRLLGARQTV
jgi:hypothetical protein